jgi:hypothetical protein
VTCLSLLLFSSCSSSLLCILQVLIVLTLFYLRFTNLELSLFQCILFPDVPPTWTSDAVVTYSSVLIADYTTLCYVGHHRIVADIAAILLLVYTIGLPLVCGYIVHAAAKKEVENAHAKAHANDVVEREQQRLETERLMMVSRPKGRHLQRSQSHVESVLLEAAAATTRAVSEAAKREREETSFIALSGLRSTRAYYILTMFGYDLLIAIAATYTGTSPSEHSLALLLFGCISTMHTAVVAGAMPYVKRSHNAFEFMFGLTMTVRAEAWEGRVLRELC